MVPQGILEILTSASEFDHLPMRHGEERALRQLAAHVPLSNDSLKYTDPHTKAFLLLQAHLSRIPVAGDLAMDQKTVLKDVLRLVQVCVAKASHAGIAPCRRFPSRLQHPRTARGVAGVVGASVCTSICQRLPTDMVGDDAWYRRWWMC